VEEIIQDDPYEGFDIEDPLLIDPNEVEEIEENVEDQDERMIEWEDVAEDWEP